MIYVRSYEVSNRGACVHVEWGNSQFLKNEEKKYDSFKKALKNCPFSLKIKARMADEE